MTEDAKTRWFCQKARELKNGMYAIAFCILGDDTVISCAIKNTLYIAYNRINEPYFIKNYKTIIYKTLISECAKQRDSLNCIHQLKTTQQTSLQEMPPTIQQIIAILYYCENIRIGTIVHILDVKKTAVKAHIAQIRRLAQ